MEETVHDPHDAVAYPCFPYPDTHPSTLAALGLLHGLDPVPVDRCRVLEMGANAGGNLIPMAYTLPNSTFVGFDLAAVPVRRGQQRIHSLGLRNVQLFQADILEAGKRRELEEPFDYILVHGVYSWVPKAVREELLALCRSRLSPRGIAFISYAALPGGHLRLLTRDILRYGIRHLDSPEERVATAFDTLEFITSCRPAGDGFRVLLERELEGMHKRGSAVVFHDELSEHYTPFLFSEFAAHAGRHGLQYVSEAELPGPLDPVYQSEIGARIYAQCGEDRIAKEQLLDFGRMRMYRQSLVCQAEANVSPELHLESLTKLFFSTTVTSKPGSKDGSRVFTSAGGLSIEAQHPATIAVLEHLAASAPEAVPFANLERVLVEQKIDLDKQLPKLLMQLVVSRMITLHAVPPPVTRTVTTHPLASALARADALEGPAVTTLLHTRLSFEDRISQRLLSLLDGTRDHETILEELKSVAPDQPADELRNDMETALRLMGQVGILERQAVPPV